MSCAGLAPVMSLAEQTGLTSMLAEKVVINEPRVKSGSANFAPKLVTLIAGMCAGADCIDDGCSSVGGSGRTAVLRRRSPLACNGELIVPWQDGERVPAERTGTEREWFLPNS